MIEGRSDVCFSDLLQWHNSADLCCERQTEWPNPHAPCLFWRRRAGPMCPCRFGGLCRDEPRRQCRRAAPGNGAEARSPASRRDCQRSEEHTSELQSLMRISYAVFCLKKKRMKNQTKQLDKNTSI